MILGNKMLDRKNFFCCRNVTTVENSRRSAALLCSFSSLPVSYFLKNNLESIRIPEYFALLVAIMHVTVEEVHYAGH